MIMAHNIHVFVKMYLSQHIIHVIIEKTTPKNKRKIFITHDISQMFAKKTVSKPKQIFITHHMYIFS